MPKSFRFDNDCPPVISQGNIGSCVSQATAYGLCGILAKREQLPSLFSPLYMHYNIKQPTPNCDQCMCMGSNLGLAAKFLLKQGVPFYSDFHPDSMDVIGCARDPKILPPAYRLKSFRPLFTANIQFVPRYKINAIRNFVANSIPVPIAMDIDESFWKGYGLKNQAHIWKTFIGNPVGGHAMLVVGYDDDRNAFLVMNSWGDGWNIVNDDPGYTLNGGFCWIDYDLMEQYVYEAFVANVDANGFGLTVGELKTGSCCLCGK